jgi:ATPase subunit of ABC transporter with duplicated ATPase domains
MLKSIIRNAGQFIGDAEHKFKIDSGNVIWGHEVTVGYFPQDFGYTIDKSKGINALDWLWQFKPQAPQEEIRAALGQMLFSGEDALKPTSGLSGGECARLIFCKLMIQKPNFLVLDEPTNNLDLESNNALNISLQKYEGTVLLVTHDEDVLDEVATRVWHFQGGKIEDFKGTYEDFQSRTQKPAAELAKGRK